MPSSLPAVERVRRARPLLGTLVEIEVLDPRPGAWLHAAVDDAFAAVERVQALMSFHDAASDLSRLNREAARRPVEVDADTHRVFGAALQFAACSGGAFDPCVAPCLEAWGYLPRGQRPCDPKASWRDIELLSGHRIRYGRELRVDLGGIAKGFAVDAAVQILRRREVESVLVNAGGDARAAGAQAHRVELRHPDAPLQSAHCLLLQDAALATSAAYFSRRGGEAGGEVSALVADRAAGTPYLGRSSVSVRAPDCMSADALTKAVMLAPRDIAQRCLAACDAQAYVLQC